MKRGRLKGFFKEYIEGTSEKAEVNSCKLLLCRLTVALAKVLEIDDLIRGVYRESRKKQNKDKYRKPRFI